MTSHNEETRDNQVETIEDYKLIGYVNSNSNNGIVDKILYRKKLLYKLCKLKRE
jgi:hypothetical protein